MSRVRSQHEEWCRITTVLDIEETRQYIAKPRPLLPPDADYLPARWAEAGDRMQLALACAQVESWR